MMAPRWRCLVLLPLLLACCARARPAAETGVLPLPEIAGEGGIAAPRVNGAVGSTEPVLPAQISLGETGGQNPGPGDVTSSRRAGAQALAGGDVALDFADTDIREVVAQILGGILKRTYTIDPGVHGTTTLRTAQPLSRAQLLPTLQAILAQNGAALTEQGGLYRVLPAPAALGSPQAGAGADGAITAGSEVVHLRYAAAEDLARVLLPFVAGGGRILASPAGNALVISGDPGTRAALMELVQAFDTDLLAGQSYALFPVGTGDAADVAAALQAALRSGGGGGGGGGAGVAGGTNPIAAGGGGGGGGAVRVAPMARINAVLVIAPSRGQIEQARRVFDLVARKQALTLRSWHVYYLQNSRSNDVAYVLQQAFTPGHVTAQPSASGPGSTAPGAATSQMNGNSSGGSGSGSGGLGSTGGSTGGSSGGAASGGLGGLLQQNGAGQSGGQAGAAQSNPLLGGLGGDAGGGGGGDQGDANAMRIIPNPQNNALLVYATAQEEQTIEAMLRKIDILPLQVRIDAVIAEVDLNDQLQYGTQFYFNSGGLNGALSLGATAAGFTSGFPGFVLSGPNGKNIAINLLQSITKVKVLSSPQLMVLDNQQARLQVGSLVPYLSQTSQSTITSGAPVVNSVDYRETGVIMQVTPRVNSNGLVTLDIAQEVSSVDPNPTQSSGTQINSPTFLERAVQSRVVVQDGQTVGLAGLISDNASTGNQGIPFLKDVPILGLLAGSQTNARTRTELLILLTPHVMHDQRDARMLTEDLRESLSSAASVAPDLQRLRPSGSPDPAAGLRRHLPVPPEP